MSEPKGIERTYVFPKSGYREIITKAICGNARKFFRYSQQFTPGVDSEPTQILGSTITQMRLKEPEIDSTGEGFTVRVNGIFEAHIWYAFNGGKSTELMRQAVHFEELIPITEYDGQVLSVTDAKVTIIKQPQCQETVITQEGKIKTDFELGLYVELIGETKMHVKIAPTDEL